KYDHGAKTASVARKSSAATARIRTRLGRQPRRRRGGTIRWSVMPPGGGSDVDDYPDRARAGGRRVRGQRGRLSRGGGRRGEVTAADDLADRRQLVGTRQPPDRVVHQRQRRAARQVGDDV